MSTQEILIKAVIFAVLVFPAISAQQHPDQSPSSFSYDSFDDSDDFTVLGVASIDDGVLQITPDSMDDDDSNLLSRSGRVMLTKPYELWKEEPASSKIVFSFYTTFLINISPGGEGIAFIIAPDLNIPLGSDGQWLGLTNDTLDGNSSNRLVAIEIDTVKQFFDPNSRHIGININSVISNQTASIADLGSSFYVWVEYNGISKLMEVYVDEKHEKPNIPVLGMKINLAANVNNNSYFGFAASTGRTAQMNSVLSWNLTVVSEDEDRKKVNIAVWFGAAVMGLLISEVSLGCYFYKRRSS